MGIPEDLIQIMILFYRKKMHYKGKFIKGNVGENIKILNHYKFSGYRAAKLNEPLPTQIESEFGIIYRWKAKTTGKSGKFCIFGVVSNHCKDLNRYPPNRYDPFTKPLIDCYGISMRKGLIYKYNQDFYSTKHPGFQQNDIIIIEYEIKETNQCKLNFYKQQNNDNEIENELHLYSINLPNTTSITAWYPIFSQCNTSKETVIIPL